MGCCRGKKRSPSRRRVPLSKHTRLSKKRPSIPKQTDKTYEITIVTGSHTNAIKCLKCGKTSYNPNDVKYKYCGYCNEFHKD